MSVYLKNAHDTRNCERNNSVRRVHKWTAVIKMNLRNSEVAWKDTTWL